MKAQSRSRCCKAWRLEVQPHRHTADLLASINDFCVPLLEHESAITAEIDIALTLSSSCPAGTIVRTLFSLQIGAIAISPRYRMLKSEVAQMVETIASGCHSILGRFWGQAAVEFRTACGVVLVHVQLSVPTVNQARRTSPKWPYADLTM